MTSTVCTICIEAVCVLATLVKRQLWLGVLRIQKLIELSLAREIVHVRRLLILRLLRIALPRQPNGISFRVVSAGEDVRLTRVFDVDGGVRTGAGGER
mgnify:CR=1 FL=1